MNASPPPPTTGYKRKRDMNDDGESIHESDEEENVDNLPRSEVLSIADVCELLRQAQSPPPKSVYEIDQK